MTSNTGPGTNPTGATKPTPTRATEHDVDFISAEQPWPGLAAFTEQSHSFFHGRAQATGELVRLVSTSHAGVLFGQSGLGKTSLIQAGLFPVLRQDDHLPVYVRLDHAETAPPLSAQILSAVAQECRRLNVDCPPPQPDDTLWSYFHRQDADFWADGIRLLSPVLVLDQFEEIFTQGQQSAATQARAAAFIDDLAGLVENRAPHAIRQRISAEPASARAFDFARANFRLMLSLREDFLPELEGLMPQMPTLRLNRLRLLPMNGQEALQVVKGGGALVEPQASERIVRFVAADQKARPLIELAVEPSLLSLICRELNLRRQSEGLPHITTDLLTGARDEILGKFYQRCLDDKAPELGDFIEDHLLSESGYRNAMVLEDALRLPQVTRAAIDTLIQRRLLRLEERSGILRVELTHDLLSKVAGESRKRRRANAALLEAKHQLELGRRRTRRMSIVAIGMLVTMIALAGLSWEMYRAREDARSSLAEADRQKLQAEQEKVKAEQARNAALSAEADAREQREIALQGREAALAAQAKTAEALNVAVAAEARARAAVIEARLQQQEAERLQVSGQMDLAMLGLNKNYGMWAKIVGSSASVGQTHDRTLGVQRNNFLYDYFSKVGFETDKTQIAGFDLSPQSHLINLQARNPVYSLRELEAAGAAKFLILDDLHEPARYFCALATPNEFPIFKRFVGTPGFPWEMQCKFMEALHLAAKGRTTEAESHLLEAASLGVLQDWRSDGFGIGTNGGLNSIAFFKYLASTWSTSATIKSTENLKGTSRDPTWRERANLVRNIYLLQMTLRKLAGRSHLITTDWKAKKDTQSLALMRVSNVLAKRVGFSVDEATLKEAEKKGSASDRVKFVLATVPKNLEKTALEELHLPTDWNVYEGWYERRLAAEAGPAYFDTSFLREFFDEKWVAETLAEWLKQEPKSSWANHIEADRLRWTTKASESATKIDAHLALAASADDAAADTVLSAAFTPYDHKGYIDAISLFDRAARLDPTNADAVMMSVLAHIEMGEAVTAAMAKRMEAAVAIAKARNARPADLAEVVLGEAVIRLEAGRPPASRFDLVQAFRESKQCDLAYFERRNWHEKMLQLLKKHRAQVCIPE